MMPSIGEVKTVLLRLSSVLLSEAWAWWIWKLTDRVAGVGDVELDFGLLELLLGDEAVVVEVLLPVVEALVLLRGSSRP